MSDLPDNYQYPIDNSLFIELNGVVQQQVVNAKYLRNGGTIFYFDVKNAETANSNNLTLKIIAGYAPNPLDYPTFTVNRVYITAECDYDVISEQIKYKAPINYTYETGNILTNFLGNMPYNTANYSGVEDIPVHQKLDRKANIIKFPNTLAFNNIDYTKYFNTDLGELVLSSYTRNLGGEFDEIEGYIKEPQTAILITEEGDQLKQEDEDNVFVTE